MVEAHPTLTPEPDAATPAAGAFAEETQDGQPHVTEHAQPQAAALEPEADGWDNDFAFNNEEDLANSTASLTDSILKYREENGRTYHAYKDGVYAFPNAERENDRLDFISAGMMVGSFVDFPKFFGQALEGLNEGGWIEMSDICFPVACDDGSLPKVSALANWSSLIMESGAFLLAFGICIR